jgi:HAD superfamily hydrolase (TIGR01509 family)
MQLNLNHKRVNGIKVVAFDCDGVMFDTTLANQTYYNTVLAQFGRPPMSPEQFRYAHAHTGEESIAYLFAETGLTAEAETFRRRMNYFQFLHLMKIEPHLKALLHWLRPGFGTAIATNRMDTMPRVLETFALGPLFDCVVTALDVPRPKPSPDALFKVADHFQVRPAEILYIGDTYVDEEASQAAGIPFVAYGNPDLKALAHIQNLAQVRELL